MLYVHDIPVYLLHQGPPTFLSSGAQITTHYPCHDQVLAINSPILDIAAQFGGCSVWRLLSLAAAQFGGCGRKSEIG